MSTRSLVIRSVETSDVRFPLEAGAGADAVHSAPEYSFAVTLLRSSGQAHGTGIALTLGAGNELVCGAIRLLAEGLAGREIDGLMADFGTASRRMADHPQLRWLGPHKGVVHLALASITNACFDLWAKSKDLPLWRLLLDLTPEQVVALLDLRYLENILTPEKAVALLRENAPGRVDREYILRTGYPGYNTAVGWFSYEDEEVRERTREALGRGFRAFKLKVGSPDADRDVRRATLLRELAGPEAALMLDANQQWTLPQALRMCEALAPMEPYWIEEPTHPDDVEAHRQLARAIAPMRIALGEQVPNRVVFKNFMEAAAVHFVQPDCTRLAGVSEFLTVSLLARVFGLPIAPHVGDMGQIHQHLVLFNHIALGHEALFLEYIPHLRDRFVHPAIVEDGVYRTPLEPGCSSDLIG
jgi:L-fuconate dehydratase